MLSHAGASRLSLPAGLVTRMPGPPTTCTQPGELIVIPHLRPHRLLRGMTHGGIVAIAGSLAFLATGMASRALADTFYVDGPNPAASDANPGTAALPYRTILGAVKARC